MAEYDGSTSPFELHISPEDVMVAIPHGDGEQLGAPSNATLGVGAARPKSRVVLPVPKAQKRRTAVPANKRLASWNLSRGLSQKVGHTYDETGTQPVPRKGKGKGREGRKTLGRCGGSRS